MNIPDLGQAFTPKEAAAYLGLSMSKMRRLIEARRIRVLRAGKLVIYEAWCREFVARYTVAPTGDAKELRRELALTASPAGPIGIDDLIPTKRKFPRAG